MDEQQVQIEGGDPISGSAQPTEQKKKLSAKQRRFLEAYLCVWNASEAARRAGYRGDANTVGPRLLANVGIQAAIEERLAKAGMEADEIIARLTEQARGDIRVFFKESFRWTEHPAPTEEIIGERESIRMVLDTPVKYTEWKVRKVVLNLDALLDPACSRLIKEFSDSPKNGLSIKIHDSQAAQVHLGKHWGIFREIQEHQGSVQMVAMSLEEWKAQRDKARGQAGQAIADFED